jgi:hypothetical protein
MWVSYCLNEKGIYGTGLLLDIVKPSHKTDVEIEIALNEGHIDLALELLKVGKQTKDPGSGPYGSTNFDVGIEVAKAAEENYPQEAIEIYQRYVDMRIEWRDRGNYQDLPVRGKKVGER